MSETTSQIRVVCEVAHGRLLAHIRRNKLRLAICHGTQLFVRFAWRPGPGSNDSLKTAKR